MPGFCSPFTKDLRMIRIERHHASGDKKSPLKEQLQPPLGALLQIAAVSLPLGGKITHKDGSHHHTKVMVETPLSHGAEVSVYRGSKENMKLIHDFNFFLQFTGFTFEEELVDGKPVFTDERMGHISPEILELLMNSDHRTSVATLLACGITCPNEIREHHTKSVSDIIGAVDLMREGHGKTLSEVLAA